MNTSSPFITVPEFSKVEIRISVLLFQKSSYILRIKYGHNYDKVMELPLDSNILELIKHSNLVLDTLCLHIDNPKDAIFNRVLEMIGYRDFRFHEDSQITLGNFKIDNRDKLIIMNTLISSIPKSHSISFCNFDSINNIKCGSKIFELAQLQQFLQQSTTFTRSINAKITNELQLINWYNASKPKSIEIEVVLHDKIGDYEYGFESKSGNCNRLKLNFHDIKDAKCSLSNMKQNNSKIKSFVFTNLQTTNEKDERLEQLVEELTTVINNDTETTEVQSKPKPKSSTKPKPKPIVNKKSKQVTFKKH